MADDVRAPADDIADGKMYLGLAQDIEHLIEDLKLRHKATHDLGTYYRIQDLRRIQREHRKTAEHLLRRGERRLRERTGKEDDL